MPEEPHQPSAYRRRNPPAACALSRARPLLAGGFILFWTVLGFLSRWTLRTTETRLQIALFLVAIPSAGMAIQSVARRQVRLPIILAAQLSASGAILLGKLLIEGSRGLR